VDDAREYIETRNAMDIVGIDQEEQVQQSRIKLEWTGRDRVLRQELIQLF
jgi:hypothetical protein